MDQTTLRNSIRQAELPSAIYPGASIEFFNRKLEAFVDEGFDFGKLIGGCKLESLVHAITIANWALTRRLHQMRDQNSNRPLFGTQNRDCIELKGAEKWLMLSEHAISGEGPAHFESLLDTLGVPDQQEAGAAMQASRIRELLLERVFKMAVQYVSAILNDEEKVTEYLDEMVEQLFGE